MLKILVVDDESIIREGLKSFPWEENGFELVGAAEDGNEALFMTKLLEPDVIISDIKMPGMDGLTLASEVKKAYPHIEILLLTGYNEIDLVKSALHLHVGEYLLKPTNFDALIKTLHRMCKSIQTRKNREDEFSRLSKQIDNALPVMKSNLLSDLIKGRFATEDEAINWFKLFEFKTGKYVMINTSFCLRNTVEREDVKENWLVSMAMTNICNELFLNYAQDVFSFSEHPLLHFMLVFSASSESKDCLEAIYHATTKIKNAVTSYLDTDITFGISSFSNRLTDIHKLYHQASIAFNQCHFIGNNTTLLFSDIQDATNIEYSIPLGKNDIFENSIRTGNYEEVKKYLDELRDNLIKNSVYNSNYVKNIIITTLLQAFRVAKESACISLDSDNMSWIQQVLDCKTQEELISFTYKLISELVKNNRQKYISHYDTVGNQMITYIQKHFTEDLSLDLLSDKFHFSTAYISRLIRRTSGLNYMEILTEARMKEAKILLRQGSLKSSEVGERIGYRDASYFIQIFKKRYGITPHEYKNLSLLN